MEITSVRMIENYKTVIYYEQQALVTCLYKTKMHNATKKKKKN